MVRSLLFIFICVSIGFAQGEDDPLDVQLGEKLFREDRFSQSFAEKNGGDFNQLVATGDPILEMLKAPGGMISHPHRGRQVSCASCHFLDQATEAKDNLVFAYNDFTTRSQFPSRKGEGGVTLRNSMNMVLSSPVDGKPLHWDGEFYSTKDLACAGITGRNMGWLVTEANQAKQHVAQVIRQDNGNYPHDADLKQSYAANFKELGINIGELSDQELLGKVCETMGVYMKSLDFSRDKMGDLNGSAYDQFLELNGLRRGPKVGESSQEYLQYLRDNINYKKDWKWLEESPLQYHQHPAKFGPMEFRGMTTFFTRGQCVGCHAPPEFTNYGFHRTGVSQLEYEQIHGSDSFAKLEIPNWWEREKQAQKYFTATGIHPDWQGEFAKIPEANQLNFVDLGVWNVVGHPDKALVQDQLKETICFSERRLDCSSWSDDEFLYRSIGSFKTPTLRSLGQTAPYFHNGMGQGLLDVLAVYMATSHMARNGTLLQPDPLLKAMHIMPNDFNALKAFMESLDEDYD